jgi:hypothetical protein
MERRHTETNRIELVIEPSLLLERSDFGRPWMLRLLGLWSAKNKVKSRNGLKNADAAAGWMTFPD